MKRASGIQDEEVRRGLVRSGGVASLSMLECEARTRYLAVATKSRRSFFNKNYCSDCVMVYLDANKFVQNGRGS